MVDPHDSSTPALNLAGDIRTFLIADVRGYTAYTLEHGDEAAARLAARFADLVAEVVGGKDGQVVELRGDEALVVFSSARQALRAAVELQTRLAAEMERDPSLPLNVGIGLDAGEAVPLKGGFRGAALNMAARLCALAGPGEVLASDGVIHLARKVEGLEYTERGMVQLKGFADPVRVMAVGTERSAISGQRSGVGSAVHSPRDLPIGGFLGALPASPLVARSDELERVLRAVEGVAGGAGRLVLLSGEPGVGKTRLAQEATLQVRNRRFAVAAGRCYEAHQTVPFYPFVEALTAAYAAAPSTIQAELPRRWPDVARLLPSIELPVPKTEGSEDQQRLFWAVTGLLQALAAVQPVALMLDDLHWADAASLELLQHLARHTRADRILLLGTFRDVEVGRRHPLEAALRDLQREELIERIDLRRLERSGTSQLMAASMGEEEISEEFAELIYRRTEGNPFFVQQVMRVLVERGDVFRREGRWDRKRIEEIEVPESIRSVVGQRLSRLPEQTQELLYEASVLGQTFGFDDLEAMTERPEREIEGALDEAAKAGLVREIDRDLYGFDHALTQQTLYGELTTRRRRRLHLAAAEAVEAQPAKKREGRAAELAWHFLEADDSERALTWSIAAGDAAMAVYAYRDAELHYRTARELARELEQRSAEADALDRLGNTLFNLARFDETIAVLEDAARLYHDLGDGEGEMRTVARIGGAHAQRMTRRDGIARLLPVLKSAPEALSPALVELKVELARLYFFEGSDEDALPIAEQATVAARALGDDRLLGRAQARRATILARLGSFDEALAGYHEAIALAEQTGDLLTLSIALNNLSIEQGRRFEMEQGEATQQRQLEVVRRLGTPADIAWALGQIGVLARASGRFEKALGAYQEAASIARSIGASRAGGASAAVAGVRLFMGDETALPELEELATSPDFQERMQARINLALWDLLYDRPSSALDRLEGLIDEPALERQGRWPIDRFIGTALVLLGELDRAEAMAEAGIEEGQRLGLIPAENTSRVVLSEVRVAQGRLAEARELAEQARGIAQSAGIVFEEAQQLYGFGAALLRAGEAGLAREPLEEALALFREIGAPPFIKRTEELLASCTPS